MRTALVFLLIIAALTGCNRKKYTEITNYNDKVVKFVQQSERTMKIWNTTNFMQEYALKKQNSISKLLLMEDSLNALTPYEEDDTLRLAALSMVDNYLHAFSIYDTVNKLLSDSLFLKTDSIRVQELLRSNQNMLRQQATGFIQLQKRFSDRYELQFVE